MLKLGLAMLRTYYDGRGQIWKVFCARELRYITQLEPFFTGAGPTRRGRVTGCESSESLVSAAGNAFTGDGNGAGSLTPTGRASSFDAASLTGGIGFVTINIAGEATGGGGFKRAGGAGNGAASLTPTGRASSLDAVSLMEGIGFVAINTAREATGGGGFKRAGGAGNGASSLTPTGRASSLDAASLMEGIGFAARNSADDATGGRGFKRAGGGGAGNVATSSVSAGIIGARNVTKASAGAGNFTARGFAAGRVVTGAAPRITAGADSTGSADGRLLVKYSEFESSATASSGFTGLPAILTS
jgi:hypothetical protein